MYSFMALPDPTGSNHASLWHNFMVLTNVARTYDMYRFMALADLAGSFYE